MRANGRRSGALRWLIPLVTLSGVLLWLPLAPSWSRLTVVVLHLVLGVALLVAAALALARRSGERGTSWLAGALVVAGLGGLAPVLLGGAGERAMALAHLAPVALALALFAFLHLRRDRAPVLVTLAILLVGGALALIAVSGEPAGVAEPAPEPAAGERLADAALHGAWGSTRLTGAGAGDQVAPELACGSAGCHGDLVEQWRSSAHALSGLGNPWYRAAYELARDELGEGAGWCAGCHSPELQLAGGPSAEALAASLDAVVDPGVSCVVCHRATAPNAVVGQASLDVRAGEVHRLATGSAFERRLHRLWVRLDPGSHRRAYGSSAARPAAACASCHRGWLDAERGAHAFFEVLDEVGPWQESAHSGESVSRHLEPVPARDCVDCHMPRAGEPGAASGDFDFRSHRFPGAQTALAAWRDDAEQLAAVEQMLRSSRVDLDLFAMTEPTALGEPLPERTAFDAETYYGPLDRIPATVRRGESRRVDVVLRAPGVGHLFPGGKTEIADVWLELEARDETGRLLFRSGRAELGRDVEAKPFRLGASWVDAEGERVDRYRIWRARGPIYLERFRPDEAKIVRFRLDVEPATGDEITLTARLRHRAVAADFHRWAFTDLGLEQVPELPVTTLAETSVTLDVVDAGGELPEMGEPAFELPADAERLYFYGLARSAIQDHATSRTIFSSLIDIAPEMPQAHIQMALAVPGLAPTREHLEAAREAGPDSPEVLATWSGFHNAANEPEQARRTLERLVEDYPRSKEVLRGLGDAAFALQDFAVAIEWYERLLALDPLDPGALLKLAQLHRAAGDLEAGDRYQQLGERASVDREGYRLGAAYARSHPEVGSSWSGLFEHRSVALDDATDDVDEGGER